MKKAILMGAAGREFHNFNVFFRENPEYDVVAFTAAQIPNIQNRIYPRKLSGKKYPKGIKIYPEEKLSFLIKKYSVDEVFFSYSDVSDEEIEEKRKIVEGEGAKFNILPPEKTMLKSSKPVISVCATRTGAGKGSVCRKVCRILRDKGYKVVVIRHPMPYGNLEKQIVQKFSKISDLDKHNCTIEEREEYEPYITNGFTVYAGVDYEKILRKVEKEADVIVWEGGNNDTSFIKPDLLIVVADPFRVGDELRYYHGRINVKMADVVVINKINTAKKEEVEKLEKNIKELNPKAKIIKAISEIHVERPEIIKDKRVLIVEDSPTVTHGSRPYSAGYFAAITFGAKEIVDPKPYAVGSIKDAYTKYPQLKFVLPSMGYGKKQIKELEKSINNVECDSIIFGNYINLGKVLKIRKPYTRITYEIEEVGKPTLEEVLGSVKYGRNKG